METGKTLVVVFDEQREAKRALDALLKGGFSSSHARLTSSESIRGSTASSKPEHKESFGDKLASFFGFGDDQESTYSEAVRRGSCVLVVDVAGGSETGRRSGI